MQDKRRVFIEPIFKGERFHDHSLPRELLPDLESYLKIVIEVAKELYRSNHPQKVRLPRGFEERFKVRLTEIASGSTMPIFCRDYDQDVWEDDEFDQARDIVNDQIAHLGHKPKCIEGFPDKLIPLFKLFGENLKNDETVELRIPGEGNIPVYSREVRSRILSINQKPYQDVCYLSGAISGFDAKNGFFYLVQGESQISGPLDGSFDISLREIAAKYKREEISVTLVGIAKYQPDNSISQIERLQHITVFKEGAATYLPDLFKRIDELAKLENGWFDGEGTQFCETDLKMAKTWLIELLSMDIPSPFIYPSPDHLLTAEWSFGFWEITCSFEFAQKVITLHATHVSSEETREDRIPFDLEFIGRAARFLKNLLSSREE